MAEDIESIIRRVVREELESALDLPQSAPLEDEPAAIADGTPLLYDVASLAAATGMSKQYVRDDIRDGHLLAVRSGARKFVIDGAEGARYSAWLASGRVGR